MPVRLAVTLGDPAGIGPEVCDKALRELLPQAPSAQVTLVGPRNFVQPLAARLGDNVRFEAVAAFTGRVGIASAESGRAALQALERAIALARSGEVDALVTAPLSKQALALAGSSDLGHTEILARELGRGPTAMAFVAPELRVVLATTHIPFRRVPEALSTRRVVEVAELLHHTLVRHFRLPKPRLALAGLNPHAGEGGLMGDEEAEILAPAVREARAKGLELSGPHPADTLFHRAKTGEFDGVVALYHDQGLIPVKLLSFGQAVNVTLGLSVPRTSPDHGTAYDLAGSGRADPQGMLGALRLALELAT